MESIKSAKARFTQANTLCAHCRGLNQWAIVGAIRTEWKWYTQAITMYDSRAAAMADAKQERRALSHRDGGDGHAVFVVPGNMPWLAAPMVLLTKLYYRLTDNGGAV